MGGFLVLACAPVALGLGIGALAGGRLHRLAGWFRWTWLLWLAVAVQVLHTYVLADRGITVLPVVFGIGLVWLGLNLRHWPASGRIAGLTILAGVLSNGVAVLANGRMPYSRAAAEIVGASGTTPKNEPMSADSRLTFLGDVIPVPGLDKIVSVGDVLIVVGTVALLVLAMRHPRGGEL
jgi:hypothetical protein